MKSIPLTRGLVAVVDDCDYEIVSRFKWHAHRSKCGGRYGKWYARTMIAGRRFLMHHFIMGKPPPGFEIDHIDGSGLNNQRSNLRFATRSQNMANSRRNRSNSSGYAGVSWCRYERKWLARVKLDRRTYYVGRYDDPRAAAVVRDFAAVQLHAGFACLNFPQLLPDYRRLAAVLRVS